MTRDGVGGYGMGVMMDIRFPRPLCISLEGWDISLILSPHPRQLVLRTANKTCTMIYLSPLHHSFALSSALLPSDPKYPRRSRSRSRASRTPVPLQNVRIAG